MRVLEYYNNADKLITKKFKDYYEIEDYIASHYLTEYTLDGIHITIIERSSDYVNF